MSDSWEAPAEQGAVGRGLLVGVFVGGASSRMGQPKGLLRRPGTGLSLVEGLLEVAATALPGAETVLVGSRPEYARLGVPALIDAASGVGPLGGLVALLRHAAGRGHTAVIAIACDFPYLRAPLVARLGEGSLALIVAPRVDERWQPLFARYSAQVLEPVEQALEKRELGLFALCQRYAAELVLTETEARELRDWDTPADVDQ